MRLSRNRGNLQRQFIKNNQEITQNFAKWEVVKPMMHSSSWYKSCSECHESHTAITRGAAVVAWRSYHMAHAMWLAYGTRMSKATHKTYIIDNLIAVNHKKYFICIKKFQENNYPTHTFKKKLSGGISPLTSPNVGGNPPPGFSPLWTTPLFTTDLSPCFTNSASASSDYIYMALYKIFY